jgi:hypothetical protein
MTGRDLSITLFLLAHSDELGDIIENLLSADRMLQSRRSILSAPAVPRRSVSHIVL